MSEGDVETQYITVDSLGRIRDNALLLSLASAYLCEEPFLIKIGRSIDVHLEKLREDISSLKKKFPGRFTNEVDTDEIIDDIHSTAQNLIEPDDELNEKCTVGELGRYLETSVINLSDAINVIRGQVDGSSASYSRAESFLKLPGWLRPLWNSTRNATIVLLKILIGLILIAVLPCAYLILTMETEGSYVKEIATHQTQIQAQEDIVSQLNQKKEELSLKINALEKGTPSRQDKVEIMDLEIEIHKIDEGLQQAEYEIDTHTKNVMAYQRRVKELKATPFHHRFYQHMRNTVGIEE
jgi:uncharacterized protein (DUF3084 family)